MTRRFRLLTVLLALGALLFAQGALAGYFCAGTAASAEIARMAQQEIPCAEVMTADPADRQAGLCHAHCQAEHSSADSYQPAALASAVQLGAVLTLAPAPDAGAAPPLQVPRGDAGPPLSIRHCCFRI